MGTFNVRGNRLAVRLDAAVGRTASGLYTPQTAESQHRWGTVVSVPGKFLHASGWLESPFRGGDRVLVDVLGATTVDVDGETLHLVRHEDVVGEME